MRRGLALLTILVASCAADRAPQAPPIESRLAGRWYGQVTIETDGGVVQSDLRLTILPTRPDSLVVGHKCHVIGQFNLEDDEVSFVADFPEADAMWHGKTTGPEIEGTVWIRATQFAGTFRLVRGQGKTR